MAAFRINDKVPNFDCETSLGPINFHEFLGDSWGILFSHPGDYTPVCTTELGAVAALSEKAEFSKRNTKVLAISCNDTESHQGWIQDINASQSCTVEFPIIADPTREIAVKWGMLDETDKDAAGLPMTVRSVFIISPDKSLKLMLAYPASTGRNFAEIIRVLDSLQLTASHKVATPVNWEQGGDCMVLPTVKPEDTAALFPKGVDVLNVPSGKPYLRQTPQPNV